MTYLSDYLDRLYEPPENAQAGYRYTSTGFTILHVTSVPQNNQAAIEYVQLVEKWYPKTRVMVIEKREAGHQEWKLMHSVEEASGQLHVLPTESVLVQPEEVPEATDPTGRQRAEAASSSGSEAGHSQPLRVVVPPVIRPGS